MCAIPASIQTHLYRSRSRLHKTIILMRERKVFVELRLISEVSTAHDPAVFLALAVMTRFPLGCLGRAAAAQD